MGPAFDASVVDKIGQPFFDDKLYAVLIALRSLRVLQERADGAARQLNWRRRGFSHAERQGRRVGRGRVGLCCREMACHCSE